MEEETEGGESPKMEEMVGESKRKGTREEKVTWQMESDLG